MEQLELETASCIRGYHQYKDIWQAAVGEELLCEREPRNSHDGCCETRRDHCWSSTTESLKNMLCSILCTVTGGRKYSSDLPQGGLEAPCMLLFKHKKPKELNKMY